MNTKYQSALNGTLVSTLTTVKSYELTIFNEIAMKVDVYQVLSDGTVQFKSSLGPISSYTATLTNSGYYFILKEHYTGAFLGVVEATSSAGAAVYLTLGNNLLCHPNGIGSLPVPSGDAILPVDSPSVLVGFSNFENVSNESISIYREQYWHRSDDSYSLGVGEKKQISYTTTSGIQQVSSDLETVATAITGSATASAGWGWGSVSATVSAGLNKTSTKMQQVTMHTETTNYVSEEYSNTGTKPIVVLKWQLIDKYTFFKFNKTTGVYDLVGAVSTAQSPQLATSSYNPNSFGNAYSPLLSTDERLAELGCVQFELEKEGASWHHS